MLSTGGRTDAAAQRLLPDLPAVCFVEVGDFTGIALRRAAAAGMARVTFVGMAGKITKLAAGVLMTHYRRSKVDGLLLAEVARLSRRRAGGAWPRPPRPQPPAISPRPAWPRCLEPLAELCRRAAAACEAFVDGGLSVDVVMVDFEGERGDRSWLTAPVRSPWSASSGANASARPPGAPWPKRRVLVGAPRHLAALPAGLPGRRVELAGDLGDALDDIAAPAGPGERVCLVVSGDPGFFGLARLARARFGPAGVAVHPAPSSVALACARAGLAWDDAVVVSAHGRPLAAAVEAVLAHAKVAVLTSPDQPPETLGRALLAAGGIGSGRDRGQPAGRGRRAGVAGATSPAWPPASSIPCRW